MRIRNTYILLVTVIGLFTLALYSTFAMFTASIDTDEFVSISASNLPTDTSMLEYERLTIEAGDSKIIDLNISNKTSNSLYYGVWYEMIEPSIKNDNIVIAKHINSSNETFGSIASNVSNKVTIIVNNKTSDSITINIGVAYSNTNSLNLPLNRYVVTGEYGNFNVSISANNATIEGGTNLTNLLSNSSFENTGWSSCSYNTTYKKYGNYSCALTGTTSTPEVLAVNSNSISLNSSHKYYSRVEAYQTSKTGTQSWQTYWPIAEPSFGSVTFGDINKWNIYSLIADRNTFTNGSYQLRFDYDNINNNGTVYYDGGMLIDLTESFGSGKEPSKEWLDSNISYFDGNISMKNDVVRIGSSITYTIKPTSGYKLDKVTCDNGINTSINGNTITVSNVRNDVKCNINMKKVLTGVELGNQLKVIANSGTPNFGKEAITDEGIYKTIDDYGTSYYFRGATTTNYVKFGKWSEDTPDIYYGYQTGGAGDGSTFREYASLSECQNAASYNFNCTLISNKGKDMYWRIIRINGNGTIRMIYDGTSAHANGERYSNREVDGSVFNPSILYNSYVGYMYGTPNSSMYVTEHANINNSNIKMIVDDWYKKNIANTEYDNKIADVVYCGDRSVKSGNGIGVGDTDYGAKYRLYDNKSPKLVCENKNDKYMMADITIGNGALTYSVGLITADEVSMAGGVDGGSYSNSNYYLYNGQYYYTMTPSSFLNMPSSAAYISEVYTLHSKGYIVSISTDGFYGVRPVISLKSSVQLSGAGTITDPFVVE